MPYNEDRSATAIKSLLKTIAKLRAPDGCPWDKEQNHSSLRPYLVEETYETLEVLDQIKSPADLNKIDLKKAFIEEWGDVLLQILLNAEIASETHAEISFESIAAQLNEKMIRRHPHVFAQTEVKGTDDVLKNWEKIKQAEKASRVADPAPVSLLDSLPRGLPPLPRTMKLIQKVTKVGFQWPDLQGPTEKLEEEVKELKAALSHTHLEPAEYLNKIEGELGDVLFSVCNIAYFVKLDPEAALRSTLRKFESRFRFVEDRLRERGSSPEQSNLDEMDSLWDEAKKMERK